MRSGTVTVGAFCFVRFVLTSQPCLDISACAKSAQTQRALILYDVVNHKKLPLDSYFYAAVIEGMFSLEKSVYRVVAYLAKAFSFTSKPAPRENFGLGH